MNSSPEDRLIYYLTIARAADPTTAAQVCREATEDPSLYVFGELLHCPTISALQNTPQASYYELLRLFAYGTVEQYRSNKSLYPTLSDAQWKKLRILSLISLAVGKTILHYTHLQEKLYLTSTRQLEDIIIHAVYLGLIRARMNQRSRTVEITNATGRDVIEPQGIQDMITTLKSWVQRSTDLIEQIDDKINYIANATESASKHKKEAAANVQAVRQSVLKGREDTRDVHNMAMLQDASDVEHPAPMAGLMAQDLNEWAEGHESVQRSIRSKFDF